MDQIRTPIIDMLRRFGDVSRGYFCIPSHHRGTSADNGFISLFGREVLKYDLTETPLTDDLHEAEGPIREAEELAADAFGADRSFFLVNGTTCGNEAMIISSVKEGEKILVAENCHKSALMGLIISGAKPVFIRPSVSPSFRAFSSVTPESVEKAFFENPDAKALFLTSPTFHGICSDIRSIAEICRRNNAYLLVDEAHGAHFAFSDRLPESAMSQGADMASQSIHKTGGSMTQSSMLHVKGGAERIAAVNEALKLVQSTSPSYILMASLDGARHSLAVRGRELTDAMLDTAEYIRKGINSVQGAICCGKDDSDFDAETEMDLDDFLVAWDNVALLMRPRKAYPVQTRASVWVHPMGGEAPGICRLYANNEPQLLPDGFCSEEGCVLAWTTPDSRPHATTAHRTFHFVQPEQGGIRLEPGDGTKKCTVYAVDTAGHMRVGDVTV